MSFPRALTIGLSALALITIPGPAAAAGSGADPHAVAVAARANTDVRFLSFDHLRAYGTSTTIRGQVAATAVGRALSNVRVRLYRKLDGTSRWHYLATRRTSTSRYPQFRFTAASIGNAHYRVRFAGNRRYQPARATTAVHVHRNITGRIEDRTGRFHGRVTPRYAHHVIHLEKRSCGTCAWRSVRTDRTGDRGRYSFKVAAPHRGRWYWRVSTPAKPRFIRSYSGVFTTRLS
jgi:hypothetical protein